MSVIVRFDHKRVATANEPLWQYDYGQTVTFAGVDIPDGAIPVHFHREWADSAIVVSGSALNGNVVAQIPNQLLNTGEKLNYTLFSHIFLTTSTSGTSVYTGILKVAYRADQSDEEPTPAQQSAWDQAMASLHEYQGEINAKIANFDSLLDRMIAATASDVGKVLTVKAVSSGGVSEWEFGNSSSFSFSAKIALLECLKHLAWNSPDGQTYYDSLESLLIGEVELSYITVVYSGSTVMEGSSLDDLRPDLVVTAHYTDGGTGRINSYNLYGNLNFGTNTITVAYGGKTATFSVTVTDTPSGYKKLAYLIATGTQYIDTDIIYKNNMAYELTVKGLGSVSSSQTYLGNIATGSDGYQFALNTLNGGTHFFRYGTNHYEGQFTPDPTHEYVATMVVNVAYLDGQLLYTYPTTTENCIDSMFLFARRYKHTTADQFASCAVKELKFWDESHTLIADMLPYLDKNRVPCMYDKIRKQTFYNLGTGTFSYEEESA